MIARAFPQIVFFDMEGTLLQKAHHLDDGRVAPSAWTLLAEQLGPECLAAENLTKQRWLDKKYSGYLHWMSETVDIHRQFHLTRDTFFAVTKSVPLMPRTEEALDIIHSWGSVTVLITGGFKALADRVQRELKLRHSFAACEYFFNDETGLLEHANLLPADEAGKADFMRLMCREYNADPAMCAFVGDGMNDVHLAREVGFSIAFNAQPELERVASVKVSQPVGEEDFTAVVEALSQHRNQHSGMS
jgi:phosphoserine phosphatase